MVPRGARVLYHEHGGMGPARGAITGGILFEQQGLTRFRFATQRVSHFAMGGPCRLLRQRREAHAGGSLHYSPKRG